MKDDDYGIRGILREHLVTERVEVPNHLLEARGRLARWLGRRTMRLRYLPMLKQLEIRKRFKAKTEVDPETELKLYGAQLRLVRDQATAEDLVLLQEDSDRWNDSAMTAALYAAVIVKPRMSERQVRTFLEGLDFVDMGVWMERTRKFLHLTKADQVKIKNLSGLPRSPTSTTTSENTGDASGKIGRGRRPRSTNSS